MKIKPKALDNYSYLQNWEAWISLVFWFLVYRTGMHPDVCWGDGMGYSISVEQGFDWATNANSHFLYLNLNHLISLFPGWENAISVLRWSSIFWAIATLYLIYQIAKSWAGPTAGLIALHGLAGSFTFWRHACIIEVYSMSTFFWVWSLMELIRWKNEQVHFSRFCMVHAFSLLVHIQDILLFPLLIWMVIPKLKREILVSLFWYLVPVLAVFISIFYLKTNDLRSVFFDNAGEKMTSNPIPAFLKSLYFIPAFWLFLLPGPTLIFIASNPKWTEIRKLANSDLGLVLVVSSLINLSFCFFFPEPGIHVFFLPSFAGFCLLLGFFAYQKWKERGRIIAWSLPFFQGFFYLFFYFLIQKASLFPISQETKWKGGIGYYLLPWANGNASSVLQKYEESKSNPAPAQLDWNLNQAKEWNAIRK